MRELAVDRAGGRRDRQPLVVGLVRAPGQHVDPLLGVAGVVEDLAGVPVVQHLVVVPLVDLRHLGGEPPVVLVEQVVRVLPAVLVQGLGHLELRVGEHVAPDPAVGQRRGLRQRPVGVHRVAAVQQEVGPPPADRLEDLEAPVRGVDAPPLPDHVAGPHEADVRPAGGGGAQRAGERGAEQAGPVQALHPYAVVDLLVGGQAGQPHLAGEARVGGDDRAAHHPAAAEVGTPAGLHPEPAGAVGAGPHDRRVPGRVAALHAVGEHRAGGCRRVRGRFAERATGQPGDAAHDAGPEHVPSGNRGHG